MEPRPSRERPLPLNPENVNVGGFKGIRWHGSFEGIFLTQRELRPSNKIIDGFIGAPNLLLARMSDGNILLVGVARPEETDNDMRGYYVSGVTLDNRPTVGRRHTTILLAHETIQDLVVVHRKPLVISDPRMINTDGSPIVIEGVVEEIVSVDTNSPAPVDAAALPAVTILDEFRVLAR